MRGGFWTALGGWINWIGGLLDDGLHGLNSDLSGQSLNLEIDSDGRWLISK